VTIHAILILPATNRVYADASVRLTRTELGVFNESVLGGRLHDIGERRLAGVPYVVFSAPELTERDVAFLSNLSSLYALFEVRDELLRPVPVRPLDRFDDDLVSIQKYAGKTNEYFTKLLLNVTALATATPSDLIDRRLAVLDPLCGRGTTLNQALMYGFDAAGVDLDRKDFDAYAAFIRTWLQHKRIKHRAEAGPVRRNRAVVARRLRVTLGDTKERYRAGEVSTLTVFNADTRKSLEFFKPATFDLVVTDAPYGVQHGSRAAGALSRSPTDLLADALPVWAELLRPGGAVGIAWNTYLARREQVTRLLADNSFEVLDSPPYLGFAHRVDQAIHRDLIVARKPA
jgi:SAM-dependent methyltransferase